MRNYATALKMRRELAHMTVRELSEKIGRSSTFVTDFELKKKANPPEPDMMRRLSQALNWSEDEQLRAWGYELSSTEDRRGNPFPLNDPRWRIVVKLQRLDINDAGAAVQERLCAIPEPPDARSIKARVSELATIRAALPELIAVDPVGARRYVQAVGACFVLGKDALAIDWPADYAVMLGGS